MNKCGHHVSHVIIYSGHRPLMFGLMSVLCHNIQHIYTPSQNPDWKGIGQEGMLLLARARTTTNWVDLGYGIYWLDPITNWVLIMLAIHV
jgi:hypothetical protein